MIIKSPYPDVEVPETSLPEFVLEHAGERGAAPAVIDAVTGRILSYRDLAAQVRRVAGGLCAHGLARGDRLALCSPNGPEFVVTYHAAALAGAVVTTVNPMATGDEVAAQLTAAGARWLVTTPELFLDKGRQAAARAGIQESCPAARPTTSRSCPSPAGRAGGPRASC
jgi:acyl-CoA synthetase (AMP-forming)/AMP-acid ligase II